ncbi:MAG: TonB family protein [Pseudomonadota bacterium]
MAVRFFSLHRISTLKRVGLALTVSFGIHLALIYIGGRALPSWENLVSKIAPLEVRLQQAPLEEAVQTTQPPPVAADDRPARQTQDRPHNNSRLTHSEPAQPPLPAELTKQTIDNGPAVTAQAPASAPSPQAHPAADTAATSGTDSAAAQRSAQAASSESEPPAFKGPDITTLDPGSMVRSVTDQKTGRFSERSKTVSLNESDVRYSMYIDAVRSKLEQLGQLNYPAAAARDNLSGTLRVQFSMRADGSLQNFSIVRSSGYPVLDAGAEKIVRLAAPFTPLPENIRRETDVLILNFTWTFSRSALSFK